LLRVLIRTAYGVRDYQVVDGPDWINSTRYNIEAKAADAATSAQLMLMLQSLLADRFKLQVHKETRNLPVYELRVDKIITKLQRPKPANCSPANQNGLPQQPVPSQGAPTRVCGVSTVLCPRHRVASTAKQYPLQNWREFSEM